MSRRRPPSEPDGRLAQLRQQLVEAEQRVLHWCSADCRHPLMSLDPPPCGHPDDTLCGVMRNRVASLERMIAEEEAKRRASSS